MSVTALTPLTVASTVTGSGALVAGQHTPADATSGAFTVTLPTPAHVGAWLRVEKIDASLNAVTISGTIRGSSSTLTLTTQSHVIELVAESLTSWRPSNDHRTTSGIRYVAATSQVLGERIWDLTGYATPTTTSTSGVRLHNDGVTFTVPDTGWVRVSFSGAVWATEVWWMILNGDGTTVPRTQLTINSNSQPVQSQLEVLVNCTAPNTALVPGATVTWYWGWASPNGSTATFDNAMSAMKIEAAAAPQGYTLGSDSIAGQTASLTTPQNVTTATASAASVSPSWSATPTSGDLLLALMMCNVTTGSWVLPSGWAIAKSQQVSTGARFLGLCYKVAGGSEPTSLTFTGTGATTIAVHLWSKRGFTTTPTVALTAGQSLTTYTTGTNIETAGGVTSPPHYAVAAVSAGATVNITRIANGWDSTSLAFYAGRGTVFVDSGVTMAMGASEKIFTEVGKNGRMSPTLSAAQAAAALIVTFSGV